MRLSSGKLCKWVTKTTQSCCDAQCDLHRFAVSLTRPLVLARRVIRSRSTGLLLISVGTDLYQQCHMQVRTGEKNRGTDL